MRTIFSKSNKITNNLIVETIDQYFEIYIVPVFEKLFQAAMTDQAINNVIELIQQAPLLPLEEYINGLNQYCQQQDDSTEQIFLYYKRLVAHGLTDNDLLISNLKKMNTATSKMELKTLNKIISTQITHLSDEYLENRTVLKKSYVKN